MCDEKISAGVDGGLSGGSSVCRRARTPIRPRGNSESCDVTFEDLINRKYVYQCSGKLEIVT
jgi:hypothetical protein